MNNINILLRMLDARVDDVFGDLSIKPDALIGSLGASCRVFRNTDISLSIHNAFRAPNINDVSSFGIADFRYEVPNFDLSPEKSVNKELGIKTTHRYFRCESIYPGECG